MAVGGHFASAQAVGRAKLHPMRAAASHVAVAARDAIGGGKPQVTVLVVEDGVNGGAIEAGFLLPAKSAGRPTGSIPGLCADQEGSITARNRAVITLLERPSDAVKLVMAGLGATLQARKPGKRRHPQVAVDIARHGADEVAAKAGCLGEDVNVRAACDPVREAAARADPQRAIRIDKQGADEVVGQAIGTEVKELTTPL